MRARGRREVREMEEVEVRGRREGGEGRERCEGKGGGDRNGKTWKWCGIEARREGGRDGKEGEGRRGERNGREAKE